MDESPNPYAKQKNSQSKEYIYPIYIIFLEKVTSEVQKTD